MLISADGSDIIHMGIYVTKVGICKRITKGSKVQVVDLQHETHVYCYGVNGGSGYIHPSQLMAAAYAAQ
jgi:hypothetical protein